MSGYLSAENSVMPRYPLLYIGANIALAIQEPFFHLLQRITQYDLTSIGKLLK